MMSSRSSRPVNCKLHFYDIEEALEKWLERQIGDGEADNYIWDRIWDLDPPVFKYRFGEIVNDMIKSGDFDESVKDRATALGMELVQ